MIEISEREEIVLNQLMDTVLNEGWDFCLTQASGGRDLSFIENALIIDILSSYLKERKEE